VVTDTLPGATFTAAPVPGTEAVAAGSWAGMTGGIGSSIEPEGTSPVASNSAVAPLAVAFRPAAEAVTVALLGEELRSGVPPTKA
jgi:hypothetical protein